MMTKDNDVAVSTDDTYRILQGLSLNLRRSLGSVSSAYHTSTDLKHGGFKRKSGPCTFLSEEGREDLIPQHSMEHPRDFSYQLCGLHKLGKATQVELVC